MSRVDVNGFATGAVQVFCEGAWGAVCTTNFDDTDAAVACRQLGFSAGLRGPQETLFRRAVPDAVCPDPSLKVSCLATCLATDVTVSHRSSYPLLSVARSCNTNSHPHAFK